MHISFIFFKLFTPYLSNFGLFNVPFFWLYFYKSHSNIV